MLKDVQNVDNYFLKELASRTMLYLSCDFIFNILSILIHSLVSENNDFKFF